MSKKGKGKAAARPAPKKKTMKAAAGPRRPSRSVQTTTETLTSQITIFLFRTSSGNKIRTAPQRAYANPGARFEWTVVNMIDGSDVPVRLTWPEGSPFGKDAIEFKSRQTEPLERGKRGRYKYVVHALDAVEDPELEIPDL